MSPLGRATPESAGSTNYIFALDTEVEEERPATEGERRQLCRSRGSGSGERSVGVDTNDNMPVKGCVVPLRNRAPLVATCLTVFAMFAGYLLGGVEAVRTRSTHRGDDRPTIQATLPKECCDWGELDLFGLDPGERREDPDEVIKILVDSGSR